MVVGCGRAGALLLLLAAGCAAHGRATHGLPFASQTPGGATAPATTSEPTAATPAPTLAPVACQPLNEQIRATYTFKPSRLNAAEQDAKAALMDQIWKRVQDDPLTLAPCLRAALAAPAADPFFLFDGSALLAAVDPGIESKALQTRLWTRAPLEEVSLRDWVETLALRGYEGFDVSAAGERWLAEPARSYAQPADGTPIDTHLGALFLFGSMDEAQATPVLARLAADPRHPGRLHAIWLLVFQLTPEAIRALRTTDVSGMPDEARAGIQALLDDKPPHAPTPGAGDLSREQIREALRALLTGDGAAFDGLRTAARSGSWTASMAAVLTAEDLPLLRRARRYLARTATAAAADQYIALSTVIGVIARPR